MNEKYDIRLMKVIHDLKNPVYATYQIINDSEIDQKMTRDLANQELEDMEDMLDNLRTDFKVRNQMELHELQRDSDTQEFFEGIKRTHIRLANNGNNNLIINMYENLPTIINIQKLNLKRTINNLISNALKHTSDGEVIVNVVMTEISTDDYKSISVNEGWLVQGTLYPGYFMMIEVKDSGCGIDDRKISKIFENNESDQKDKNWDGTGLGLPICVVLCRKQGAFIKYKSTKHIGSIFRLYIPQKRISANRIGHRISIQSEASSMVNNNDHLCHSILFVEDNTNVMIKYQKYAKKQGIKHNCFYNGRHCLAFIKMQLCNLCDTIMVMTDLKMPYMDGIELASHLRELEQTVKTRFIIILVSAEENLNGNNLFDEVYYKPLPIKKINEFYVKYYPRDNYIENNDYDSYRL